jgi:hypothetical protein
MRSRGALGAEIGVPGLAAGAGGLGELLAMPVGAFEAAEIGAFAGTGAGDEERHTGLLRLSAQARREQHDRSGQDGARLVHGGASADC